MMIFGVLLLVGIGFLIYFAAKNRPGESAGSGDGAVEILKARYARGEISNEEYQLMLKELKS